MFRVLMFFQLGSKVSPCMWVGSMFRRYNCNSDHLCTCNVLSSHYGVRQAIILGSSWDHLGAILGPSWCHLGPSWSHLGPSWPPGGRRLGGPSKRQLTWGHISPYCVTISEPSWGSLGAILRPSWGYLGAFLGPSWVSKSSRLCRLDQLASWRPSWSQLGTIL